MYKYDIKMPTGYKEVLFSIVQRSNSEKSLVGICDFQKGGMTICIGDSPGIQFSTGINEDLLYGFECMGFLRSVETDFPCQHDTRGRKQKMFYLTPDIFKWADYQKKNRLKKYFVRHPDIAKNIMIGFSFIVSLFVAITQLITFLKTIPMISPWISWIPTQTPIP